MNIDWSKAPESFPLWIEDLHPERGGDLSGWHNENLESPDGSYWDYFDEGSHFRIHRKPEPWNGEGLPPIGTVCWYGSGPTGNRTKVKVIAHQKYDEPQAVGQIGDGPICIGSLEYFHPIRPPEQIAMDERKRVVEAVAEELKDLSGPKCLGVLYGLYDLGYLKKVAP
jgi:hypothetical protein